MKNLINAVKPLIANSTLVTGTQNLLNDITTVLLVLVPIVGAICIIVFSIMRSQADEQDKKMWTGRIKTALISTIIAFCASGIVNLVVSYYA